MTNLLPIFTFAGVALILLAIVLLIPGARKDKVRQRLEAIEKGIRRGSESTELHMLRDELMSAVPLLNRTLLRWSWSGNLRDYLKQAGMTVRPAKVILLCGVMGLGAYVCVQNLYRNSILALVAGIVAGLLPLAFVSLKRAHRFHAFEKNFADAIDLLGRAVRAGHSFTTGLEMIAQELADPVAGEFRHVYEEQNFGLPLRDALLNMAERMPLIDVRFFVTALLIQKETGGNLAEILKGLSHVIRDRFKVLGEVRVRTAQGRLTAGILIALPPMMMLALRALNPEYMRPLFDDPWGPYILGTSAVMQLVGATLLWRIVKIEV
jgi:tight adherence protein B